MTFENVWSARMAVKHSIGMMSDVALGGKGPFAARSANDRRTKLLLSLRVQKVAIGPERTNSASIDAL